MLSCLASGIYGICFDLTQTTTTKPGHTSLNKDSPVTRPIETIGSILPVPILGGLHHQHARI